MLGIQRVIPQGRQSESTDAVSLLVVSPILVARRQRVVRRDLKIEPLACFRARARVRKRSTEPGDLQSRGIDIRRVHYRKIIEIPPLDAGKKRHSFPSAPPRCPSYCV